MAQKEQTSFISGMNIIMKASKKYYQGYGSPHMEYDKFPGNTNFIINHSSTFS